MQTLYSAALLAALTITSVGCSPVSSASVSSTIGEAVIEHNGDSRAHLHSYNLPAHGVALDGYCPVAYFAVNKPVKGKPEHASIYNGVTYHFVSADAQKGFESDPEKYIPAYGGWCAFGMSIEDKFPVDPKNFKIVNGRLLVFLKNEGVDAHALWNKGNEKEHTAKAETHWKKVQG